MTTAGASFNSSAVLVNDGNVYVWGRLPKDHSSESTSKFLFVDSPKLLQVPHSRIQSLHVSPSSTMLGMLHENGTVSICNTPLISLSKDLVSLEMDGECFGKIPVFTFEAPIARLRGVSVGCEHVLMLDELGNVYSWGNGNFGVLGHGNFESTLGLMKPKRIETLTLVQSIAAGAFHSICSNVHGELFAWGNGGQGRLGLGSLNQGVWIPTKLESIGNAGKVFCGDSHSAYVSLCEKELYVWGSASFHRLGLGYDCSQISFPTRMEFFTQLLERDENLKVSIVSLGMLHSACVVGSDLYVWGDASNGKLGPGVSSSSAEEKGGVAIPTWVIDKVYKVSCGTSHTLVCMKNGEVLAFGGGAMRPVELQQQNKMLTMRDCSIAFFSNLAEQVSASSLAQSPRTSSLLLVPMKECIEVDDLTHVQCACDEIDPRYLLPNAFSNALSSLSNQELVGIAFDILHSNKSVSYVSLERELQQVEMLRIDILELVQDKIPQQLFELECVEREVHFDIVQYVEIYSQAVTVTRSVAALETTAPERFAILLANPQLIVDFWQRDPRGNLNPMLLLCRDLYNVTDTQSERLFHKTVQLVMRINLEHEFQRHTNNIVLVNRSVLLTRRFLLERIVFLRMVSAVYATHLVSVTSLITEFVLLVSELDRFGMDFKFDPLLIEADLMEEDLAKRLPQKANTIELDVVYLKPVRTSSRNSYDEDDNAQQRRTSVFHSSIKIRTVLETKLNGVDALLCLVEHCLLENTPCGLQHLFCDFYKNLTWTFIRCSEAEVKLAVMRTWFHLWCAPPLLRAGHEDFVQFVDGCCFSDIGGALQARFGIAWYSNIDDCINRFQVRMLDLFPFQQHQPVVGLHMILAREFYRDNALVLFPPRTTVDFVESELNHPQRLMVEGEGDLEAITVVIGHTVPKPTKDLLTLEEWIRAQQVQLPNSGAIRMNAEFMRAESREVAIGTFATTIEPVMLDKLVLNFTERVQCLRDIEDTLDRFIEVKHHLEALLSNLQQQHKYLMHQYMDSLANPLMQNPALHNDDEHDN